MMIIMIILLCMGTEASAQEVSFEHIADAIYHAEGGLISKPYGILKPYCNNKSLYAVSQCRKGCLQTIEKRYRMWLEAISTTTGSQDFISYLSRSYAPLNAKNDPSGLNKHWIKNVTYFLNHPKLVMPGLAAPSTGLNPSGLTNERKNRIPAQLPKGGMYA